MPCSTRQAQASPCRLQKINNQGRYPSHAGYVYSGQTAAHAALVLSGRHFSRVIVMGPDHRVGFSGASVSTADAYGTPLGTIRLSDAARKLRKPGSPFTFNASSDATEHSVEVVLPFLQTYLSDFSLVPVVMGPGDINAYVRAIAPFVDERTLLVASSDLSHYLPLSEAKSRDAQTIDMIKRLKGERLTPEGNRACGAIPIRVILEFARKGSWEPVLLHYATSADANGDAGRVVGYAAIAFFGGQPMDKHFSREQGMALVALARATIQEHLGVQPPANPRLRGPCDEDAQGQGRYLRDTHMNGQLRDA